MYRALDNYGRLKYIERDDTFEAISNGSKVGLLGVKYGAHQFRSPPATNWQIEESYLAISSKFKI